jgi:hypothetical protein
VTINLTYAAIDNPFDAVNGVVDILYVAADLDDPARNPILFPGSCIDKAFEVGCGKALDDLSFNLCFQSCSGSAAEAYIPKDHRAHIIFCARDNTGKIIFRGEGGDFYNDPARTGEATVTINITRVDLGSCT